MARYNEKEKKSGDLTWLMWFSRIRACQRFREEYLYGEQKWQRFYNIYNIQMWEDQFDDQYDLSSDNLPERINVPITTSTILTIIPFLINERASFHLDPKRPQDIVNAMLKEKVLNDEFIRKDCQTQLKKTVYDGIIIGHGISKTGFVREIDQAKSKGVGDIEYDILMEDESVYVRRIDPRNFWFDYNASDKTIDTARYTIERYFKYLPDVVENSSYKSSVREKIAYGDYNPTMISSLNSVYANTNVNLLKESAFYNYESEMAVMYEVWDKKYNQVLTFIDGVPEPLMVMDNPYPYLKGEFPYTMYQFIYRPNEFYPMGLPEFTEHQQYELNRHRTFAFNHRRRASARVCEIAEDVDSDEAEKLPGAEDGTYIVVPRVGSIKPIEDIPLPRDYGIIEALIKQDIQDFTGADALARGTQLQSRATLGEVQVRTNILTLKLNERVAEVDKLFLKVGKQLNAHIGGQYSKSQIIKLRGQQGEYWVEVNAEDLKDEVDVRMETVSAPKRNPELEQQQKIQMFSFAMQLLPLMEAGLIPKNAINFVELLKWTLEGFERVDIGRFFPSALFPVTPLQEQTLTSDQVQGQLSGGQAAGAASTQQDLIRSLASGNPAGLQVAGAAG